MDIIISTELNHEFGFRDYKDFLFKKQENSFTVGDTIVIGYIDCSILESLGDDKYKIEVQTALIEKFATCLRDEIMDCENISGFLSDSISCEEEKEEVEFYLRKISFLNRILDSILEQYNLQKCSSCVGYINLDKEYNEEGDKKFCSSECQNIHSFSCEQM